ncbi:GAF domain-containing sensor histidine kinase [Deinococcus peraridilitoris]|uniref:histidine kinase n=1 Tax=Deinococcus peraridilitoris (strain DSM 19664 / LMG 22246 / CIP 109416 / KR-200) TaxID=937777 RepID=L0A5N3_DEIPD|nr:ATP-binding protein [Deinococcus peraridilitoris]AFZ68330.1 bacteriophytochrome (light-regulated signal transduction histidine kinase) [Deinococcus peraridilitoris DSM 19664]
MPADGTPKQQRDNQAAPRRTKPTERTRLLQQARPHDAFATLLGTHAQSTTLEQAVLLAFALLQDGLPDTTAVYAEAQGAAGWYVHHASRTLTAEHEHQLLLGRPPSTLREVTLAREAYFFPEGDRTAPTTAPDNAALSSGHYPLSFGSQLALLSVVQWNRNTWDPADQGLFLAVGRALNWALARLRAPEHVRTPDRPTDTVHSDAQLAPDVLREFSGLLRDLSLHAAPHALVQRAQQVALSLFPRGYALYYELHAGQWRCQVQLGAPPPELQALIDAGLAYNDAPMLVCAWTRREACYTTQHPEVAPPMSALVGSVGSMASLPVLIEGQPVGVLLVALFQRNVWSAAQRTVLEALVRTLGLAMERAAQLEHLETQRFALQRRNQELEEERAALNAFARFTEASTQPADVTTLARLAVEILRISLRDVSVGYYTLSDGRWKALVLSEDIDGAAASRAREGFLPDTPSFASPFLVRGPSFVDGWNADREGVEHTEDYGAGAQYPYLDGGEPGGLLTMGTRHAHAWTERERLVFRAVGRSLELALERAATTVALQRQAVELEARAQILEAFAALSRDLAFETDRYALIRSAQEIVCRLLPSGYAVYYELHEDLWYPKAQTGNLRSGPLQAMVNAGLPREALGLGTSWAARRPWYQDSFPETAEAPRDLMGHVQARAILPLEIGGNMVGLFCVGLFQERHWTPTDRTVLETAVRNLGLALERAEAVRELQTQQAQLQAANEELEAFAYSVSHDLRTPVRHITGFSSLLRQALGAGLDRKTEKYLSVVEGAAGRMNSLIDAMLELSRTSRLPLRLETVNLAELMEHVRQECEADLAGRQVNWKVSGLPEVQGDRQTLHQVLVNLISNALKYSRTREVSRIDVWAEEHEHGWAIFVRDNGVGFDPAHGSKLFGVFQRLHRQEEFEGTGVGLANVRRIVHRHGGQVWAEGRPEEGATFGFSLPKPG